MNNKAIASGVVHDIPDDLTVALVAHAEALDLWEGLTPLARNEWICWVQDAKQLETRKRRIDRLRSDITQGKRRPCCWPGCSHRERNGKAK